MNWGTAALQQLFFHRDTSFIVILPEIKTVAQTPYFPYRSQLALLLDFFFVILPLAWHRKSKTNLWTSKLPLENSRFVSKASRFTSTETSSAEPSHSSRWVELLEEAWRVQGYRLLSITPVDITARITFSDNICSKQKEEWVIYTLKHSTYTFGTESENKSPGGNCQYKIRKKNYTFKAKGKGKGRKMQAKWAVGRRKTEISIQCNIFFKETHNYISARKQWHQL